MPRLLFLALAMARPKQNKTKGKSIPAPFDKIAIQINYKTPESLRVGFANHLIVQHDENTFYLSFFEALPPVLVGTEEERMQQLASLGPLPAYCVAKIAIPGDRMEKFVEVLAGNVQQRNSTIELIKAHTEKADGSNNGKK